MKPSELRKRLILALSDRYSAEQLAEVFGLSARHVKRLRAAAEGEQAEAPDRSPRKAS